MRIIIEILESDIPKGQDIIEIPLHFMDGKICEAGGYGFDVLPKGYGRLGDLDALKKEVSSWGMNDYEPSDFTDAIDQADTIIKADKGE